MANPESEAGETRRGSTAADETRRGSAGPRSRPKGCEGPLSCDPCANPWARMSAALRLRRLAVGFGLARSRRDVLCGCLVDRGAGV